MGRAIPRAVGAAVIAGSVLAAGCTDRSAPGEAAFRPVLEPVAREAYCPTLNLARVATAAQAASNNAWPVVVPAGRPASGWEATELPVLDRAVAEGLLTRTAGRETVAPVGTSVPPAARDVVTYAPTEKGRPYTLSVTRRTMGGQMRPFPALCDALGEVAEVVRWTEPADVAGRRVSRVTYRYRGTSPRPGLTKAGRAATTTPREATRSLELTSDGWRLMS